MTTTKVEKKLAFETLTSQTMRRSDGPPLPLWERPDRIEDAIQVRGFSPRRRLSIGFRG
jgi:hypothetical protein